ncbi:TatD family hydrolase [Stygiolobus caldivivus]|uniref:TatD family hydrolase n=1 Tax=Stygiolobus caldivivus TaxID=2824673 RepID=A0A8D5ZGW5_9CREN|nr:TatD family hydrolase [Stygiolobus caldivivus]BCU69179.1 TatD family hydrolase [Stygiolobus caldivivus]
MYIDAHAHIDVKEFDQDRDVVVNECKILIVNAGVDLNSNLRSLELERKYRNVIAAIGFHPEFIKDKEQEILKSLELTERARIISEIGLDYYWIKEEELRKKQLNVLELFLQKAERENKTAIIHVRGGMKDLLSTLPSYKVRFVIHAFEGSVKDAKKIIDLGGLISFPPVLVRDKYRQEVVKQVELDYLMTETDSPFLGPEKNTRNKPCNVALTVKKISELKNVEENEVIEKITKNFKEKILASNDRIPFPQ